MCAPVLLCVWLFAPCLLRKLFLMCGWSLRSLQLDNLEFDGEEINGLARCPFDSKQTNVALFAGKGQAHTRPRTQFISPKNN